jgi:hypothetical protein
MGRIGHALRVTAIAALTTGVLAAPAVAQRLPIPDPTVPTVPEVGTPKIPDVPLPKPGATGLTLPTDITDLPDILGRRGNHQGKMVAKSSGGDYPNQPVYDPTISGDGRINRYVAFSSAATNLVGGSGTNRNLFVMRRAGRATVRGNNWRFGPLKLISKGRGGPANGDSWGPSFSGFDQGSATSPTIFAPKCLAFASDASNLVRGDRNGRADAFIKRMPSGGLRRIAGRGPVTEVAMDGLCRSFVYVSGGTLYWAKTNGRGARRISGRGGVTTPEVSANGKTVVFERSGVVYGWVLGRGTRRIARGSSPTTEEWGRHLAYVDPSGRVVLDRITSSAPPTWCPKGTRLGGGRCGIGRGSEPSMTAGGHFVFFTAGTMMTSNVYENISHCPTGYSARQVSGSAHGNYAVYGCTNGRIYFSYVGPL